MKTWIFLILAAACVAALTAGCGGGGVSLGNTLEGTIVDATTGDPLSNVRVALGGVSGRTKTDGNFFLTGLPKGDYVLSAQLDNYEIVTIAVTIQAGANLLPDNEPIRMAAVAGDPPGDMPRTIQGTITLTGTSNAAGVTVKLFLSSTLYDSKTTASDGKYYFWVPTGVYTIRVEKPGFTTEVRDVTVTDLGSVGTADFTLE